MSGEALTAAGVGSIGCAAAAGAAGSLVEQGFACAENGGSDCSAGAFAESAVTSAVAGAVGGALGKIGGSLLAKAAPKAMKVVGGLFGKAATEAEETATTDATEAAASQAESEGAGTRAQSHSDEPGTAGEEGGPGCRTHSFTGATRVLMADGSTKAIGRIKVGDTIANSVPGARGLEAHKVTAVIVTRTDHDYVDLTIRQTGKNTARHGLKAGAKSLAGKIAKKAARKAAFGLAASAAVLGTLHAGHGHDATDRPATATVAAAGTIAHDERTAPATQDAHLTTTYHHPFYDQTRSAFVDAQDLHPGDTLQTPTGTTQVTSVRLYHANTTTYDLTIGTLHTYYVEAGDTPILVHNCNTESVAADLDKMAYNGKTVGQAVRVNPDGSVTKLGQPLISGRSPLAEEVNSALKEAGVRMPSNGRFPAAEHPDTQFAYLLGKSKSGVTSADIVINKVGGACEGDYSCSVAIPKLLPKGSTLRIHSPLKGGGMDVQEFVGE